MTNARKKQKKSLQGYANTTDKGHRFHPKCLEIDHQYEQVSLNNVYSKKSYCLEACGCARKVRITIEEI